MALIDPRRANADPIRSLVKAAIIIGRGAVERGTTLPWPEDDHLCGLIFRGAVPPTGLRDPAPTRWRFSVAFLDALGP